MSYGTIFFILIILTPNGSKELTMYKMNDMNDCMETKKKVDQFSMTPYGKLIFRDCVKLNSAYVQ